MKLVSETISADEDGLKNITSMLKQYLTYLQKDVDACEQAKTAMLSSWRGPACDAYVGRLNGDLTEAKEIIEYLNKNIVPMQENAYTEYTAADKKAAGLFEQV